MPPLPFQYATTYSRLNVRKTQPCLTTEHYNMHITQPPVCQRVAKGGKPHCKRPCFIIQKAAFYRAICRKLGFIRSLFGWYKNIYSCVYLSYLWLHPASIQAVGNRHSALRRGIQCIQPTPFYVLCFFWIPRRSAELKVAVKVMTVTDSLD